MENEELFQNNKIATCKYKSTVAVWQTFSLCFLNVFFQKFKFKDTSLRPPKSYFISIFLINNSTAGFPIKKSGKVLKIIVYWKRNLIEIFPTLNFFLDRKKVLADSEAVVWRYSVKNVFLKILQNSWENTCVGVSFKLKNFVIKENSTQVFSWEFSEIFKNSFFYGTPPVAASEWNSLFQEYMHVQNDVTCGSAIQFNHVRT